MTPKRNKTLGAKLYKGVTHLKNKAWYTLNYSGFNEKEFLYHYTSMSTAFKILNTDTLRLSKLSRTNDTSEAKPKISVSEKEYEEKMRIIYDYFSQINQNNIELACFCRDTKKKSSSEKISDSLKYDDYSGRGFALPRMWAQYAENNKGVCFIFNKKSILESMDKLSPFIIKSGNVKYVSSFSSFPFEPKKIDNIYSNITKHTGMLVGVDMLRNSNQFIDYNYFSKSSDWVNENEYRILAFNDSKDNLVLDNVHTFLEGVVVGERTDETDIDIIKLLCEKHKLKSTFDVKKISFNSQGCTIL